MLSELPRNVIHHSAELLLLVSIFLLHASIPKSLFKVWKNINSYCTGLFVLFAYQMDYGYLRWLIPLDLIYIAEDGAEHKAQLGHSRTGCRITATVLYMYVITTKWWQWGMLINWENKRHTCSNSSNNEASYLFQTCWKEPVYGIELFFATTVWLVPPKHFNKLWYIGVAIFIGDILK